MLRLHHAWFDISDLSGKVCMQFSKHKVQLDIFMKYMVIRKITSLMCPQQNGIYFHEEGVGTWCCFKPRNIFFWRMSFLILEHAHTGFLKLSEVKQKHCSVFQNTFHTWKKSLSTYSSCFPFLHSFCIKQSIRAVTCYTSYETAKIPFKWPGITVHVSAYVIVVASSS